ncbi:hypothetical protein, partial [Klebsiella michiganensis]
MKVLLNSGVYFTPTNPYYTIIINCFDTYIIDSTPYSVRIVRIIALGIKLPIIVESVVEFLVEKWEGEEQDETIDDGRW